jgi:hypothetical protein
MQRCPVYWFGNAFEGRIPVPGRSAVPPPDCDDGYGQRFYGHTGGLAVSELNMETPGEDAAEQARPLAAEEDADDEELEETPLEVDEADAAEQTRDAGYDDEDYR